MKKLQICFITTTLIIATMLTVSCNKEKNDNASSTLHVRLTDAPVAFDEVNVDIREVRVKFTDDSTDNGWFTLATIPGIYNLLAYQNGVDTLLATGLFPVQTLKEIRFVLGPNNTIKDGGVVYPLTIPSGSESGLKIKLNRSLNATLETVLVDFDAALSIMQEGNGDYKLKPVLRIR
ncbi:MAG: DUF4382 domain-containing protein [Ferruginibacter sp.]